MWLHISCRRPCTHPNYSLGDFVKLLFGTLDWFWWFLCYATWSEFCKLWNALFETEFRSQPWTRNRTRCLWVTVQANPLRIWDSRSWLWSAQCWNATLLLSCIAVQFDPLGLYGPLWSIWSTLFHFILYQSIHFTLVHFDLFWTN